MFSGLPAGCLSCPKSVMRSAFSSSVMCPDVARGSLLGRAGRLPVCASEAGLCNELALSCDSWLRLAVGAVDPTEDKTPSA